MRNRDVDARRDDEYDQELVDWLDVIGKLTQTSLSILIATNDPQIPKSKPFRP
jgi:hypothetical protein